MSRTLTPPAARVPIGTVQINGRPVDVQQHPEFVRFFFDLFARVGSTAALSNTELEALALSLDDAAIRMDAIAGLMAQLRDALGALQAGEMVMQRAATDAIFADVMQGEQRDGLAHETTFYG